MTSERILYLEKRKQFYRKNVKKYIFLLNILRASYTVFYIGIILVLVLQENKFISLSIILIILFSLRLYIKFLKDAKRFSKEKLRRINNEIWLEIQRNLVI